MREYGTYSVSLHIQSKNIRTRKKLRTRTLSTQWQFAKLLVFFKNNLANKFDKNSVGLYRGDGLALFKNINGHRVDKIRKEFPHLFGEEDNTKGIIYRN